MLNDISALNERSYATLCSQSIYLGYLNKRNKQKPESAWNPALLIMYWSCSSTVSHFTR